MVRLRAGAALFFLLVVLAISLAPPLFSEDKAPTKIYVGFYPIKLNQFSLKDESFQADFYIWFKWKGQAQLPGYEIMNGDYNMVGEVEKKEMAEGVHYEASRLKGTFFIQTNLKNYPFDKHRLQILVENQEMDISEAIYLPDKMDMQKLTQISTLTGWMTKKFNVFSKEHVYETDFGTPEEASASSFSQLIIEINVERRVLPYIIKYSLPLFVIVFMTFLSFYFHPENIDMRGTLTITGILSVVVLHITQSDALPEIGYLVTADYFFILSYIACALALVEIVYTHQLLSFRNLEAQAIEMDRRARFYMPLGFTVIYLIVITIAMTRI